MARCTLIAFLFCDRLRLLTITAAITAVTMNSTSMGTAEPNATTAVNPLPFRGGPDVPVSKVTLLIVFGVVPL